MYYKLKSKESLSKIASKFNIPIELILAYNTNIISDNDLTNNKQIYIPNLQDIPIQKYNFPQQSINSIIFNAKSAINQRIRYNLGSGGFDPKYKLPTKDGLCDCSGFVCWALGISRETDFPFYAKFGGWINTYSIVADINSSAGIFEKLTIPEVGCIVVYPRNPNKLENYGHIGIVSKVDVFGQMLKVIHCSSGNDRTYHDSIQETSPTVFNRADTVWGRFSGL